MYSFKVPHTFSPAAGRVPDSEQHQDVQWPNRQLHPQLSALLLLFDCTSFFSPLCIAAVMNSIYSISSFVLLERRDPFIVPFLSFAERQSGQFPDFLGRCPSCTSFTCPTEQSWTCETNCPQLLHNCMMLSFNGPIL